MTDLVILVIFKICIALAVALLTLYVAGVHRRRGSRDVLLIGPEQQSLPVRLRGLGPGYPAFWRPGRLDLATAQWRPRSRWGVPASLAGAKVRDRDRGSRDDYLPPFANGDTVLTCVDAYDVGFQLAFPDDSAGYLETYPSHATYDDAYPIGVSGEVRRCLAAAGRGQEQAGVRVLRRFRNRVPLYGAFALLALVLVPGAWLLPLATGHQVDGVVVENSGADKLCVVVASDRRADEARGYVDCGDLQPGEHMRVSALGWPRTGSVDTASDRVTSALVFAGLPLLWTVIGTVVPLLQRRQVRRTVAKLRSASG